MVPFQAGGLTDVLSRLYAESFSKMFNQSVVVENRPGAGGLIAARIVTKSAPDGHTILFALSGSLWPSRVMYRNLEFDPDKDFTPLAITPVGATAVGVPAASHFSNLKELVERSRTRNLTMGVIGAGSAAHIVTTFLNQKYSANLTPIFYKGEASMWTDLAGGQIDAAMGSLFAFEPLATQGKIRAIGFRGAASLSQALGVSSLETQGFKESVFRLESKYVMCVPTGTPKEAQDALVAAIRRSEEMPRVREIRKMSGVADGFFYGADESKRRWMAEMPLWVDAVSKLGISID